MQDLKLFSFHGVADALQEWPFEAQDKQGKELREGFFAREDREEQIPHCVRDDRLGETGSGQVARRT